MSFSENIKKELCSLESELCCQKAECFGLLLFGRSFSSTDISVLTQSPDVAKRYSELITDLFGVRPKTTCSRAGKYTVCIDKPADIAKILSAFGYNGKEIALRVNHANIENECCLASFLRGAFLSSGIVTDPERDYHLEFLTAHQKLSLDLKRIIEELEITPKQIRRKSGYGLYIKDGESVEDILGFMGATKSFLQMMNIRASKNMRNKINRQMNFEAANLSRTIEANMSQLDDIYTIRRLGFFEGLEEDLKQLSALRLENREATLQEIGEMLTPPLSRCAVSRRFKKLQKIAAELKEKYENTEH